MDKTERIERGRREQVIHRKSMMEKKVGFHSGSHGVKNHSNIWTVFGKLRDMIWALIRLRRSCQHRQYRRGKACFMR